ncbi:MAG: phasin family protein [Gammaproteobacteria bacterium]|jgi:phasin family protein
MEYKGLEQFNIFGKAAMESAKELETLNVQLFEKLTRKNMELFSSTVDMNNKFFALLGNPGDVQGLLNEQIKLSSEFNGKVVSTLKEATEIVTESQNGYQAWFEAGLQNVTETAQEIIPAAMTKKRKAA